LHSTQQLEDIVSKKIQNFENTSMLGDGLELKQDMERFSSGLFTKEKLIGFQDPVNDRLAAHQDTETEDQKRFNHQYLMKSMHSSTHSQDQLSIAYLHKFNDHNLRVMDVKEQLRQNMAAVAVNRVYRNSLSLAALQFRLGHYDAALSAILEAIKIAQNKNDHETVLDCSVWLQQIHRALGNAEKDKELME